MSLQTRLAAFITALGADIKSLQTGKTDVEDFQRVHIPLNTMPNVITAGWVWVNGFYNGYANYSYTDTPFEAIWKTIPISEGTWTVEIFATKGTNGGHVTYDFSVDGGSTWIPIASAVDLYDAGGFQYTVLAGIDVPESGRLDFRVRGIGTKHASSSGYYTVMNEAVFFRTA